MRLRPEPTEHSLLDCYSAAEAYLPASVVSVVVPHSDVSEAAAFAAVPCTGVPASAVFAAVPRLTVPVPAAFAAVPHPSVLAAVPCTDESAAASSAQPPHGAKPSAPSARFCRTFPDAAPKTSAAVSFSDAMQRACAQAFQSRSFFQFFPYVFLPINLKLTIIGSF